MSVWKPTLAEREEILSQASILYSDYQKSGGSVRGQMVMPQDNLDYFVVDATLAYVLSNITTRDI